MKPDIYIETDNGNIVLDTKWKNLNGYNPSPDDLRQMYVYHEYFDAKKVALVYPGNSENSKAGTYLKKDGEHDDKICSVVLINVKNDIKEWQQEIGEVIKQFVDKIS
jgi:5-methylcytosine-specific restriction enzyme subunit McrC